MLLLESRQQIELLWGFRDNVPLRTPQGKEYVGLFYKHSAEVTSILIKNPEIMTQAKKSLDVILPEIQSSLRTDKIVVTQETKEVIEKVLDSISAKASAELNEDINKLIIKLKNNISVDFLNHN